MLTKVLLTLLVIVGAWLLLKRQRRQPPVHTSDVPRGRTSWWGWGLLGLLVLLLLGGAALALVEWQEQRVLLEVRVINPSSGEEQRYRVYRSALQGRQFTTVDGLEVQLSASERVEVQEVAGQ